MAPIDGLDVSPEFIEQSRHLKLGKTSKKGGPYTKNERVKRRAEVYRLHFENGIPAVRIAEFMKVDKNTIYSDIDLLYRELGREYYRIAYDQYITKFFARLESQRSRLMLLAEPLDAEKKIAVERLIAEIDFKLLSTSIKISGGEAAFWEAVYSTFNDIAEKEGIKYRAATLFEMARVNPRQHKKLKDFLKQEGVR